MSEPVKAVATPIKPPPFKITRPNLQDNYLNALIYGDYGAGKTLLSASSVNVPSMNDVLLVSAESGETTLDTDLFDSAVIDMVNCQDFKTVALVYDFLKLHCKYREAGDMDSLRKLEAQFKGCSPSEIDTPKQYRTVIIDSLTEIEAYCMYQLLGISDSTGLQEETQSAEWSEYKKQHSMVQRLIRAYRDLPLHVIFTCARSFLQDEQKKMLFSPAMTGKLSSQVQGFVDLVGYLTTGAADEKGNIPRRLYVQPIGRFSAKCRFSRFKKPYIDNPTMASIMEAKTGVQNSQNPKKGSK